MLATLPTPSYTGIPGAVGNESTCAAQGFFVQLGLTSMLFNMALSVYYWLMICHRWTERKFRQIRVKVYVALVFIGLGLACGALPFYENTVMYCYLVRPKIAASWFPLLFFFVGPISLVVIVSTICTLLILHRVRQTEKALMKYMHPGSANQDQLFRWTRRVWYKSCLYLGGFYLTYGFLFIANIVSIDERMAWMSFTWAVLAPAQGSINFLIYFLYKRKERAAGRTLDQQPRRGSQGSSGNV